MDMPSETRVSAVMAAYTLDRWDTMREAMESLRHQTLRPDEIVLVVDRNEELLARANEYWTDVRVVPSRYRGNSGARTTGYEVTSSELIAFVDDDVVGDPRWIEKLVQAAQPDGVLGCAGYVGLQWESECGLWDGQQPRWYPDEFFWVLGGNYRGQPVIRSEIRNVIGGIMVFNRKVFAKVGGFSSALGRVNGSLISCEETEFCLRASAAFPDGHFLFVPEGKALHKVPRRRQTLRYFIRRCYAEGCSKAILAGLVSQRDALDTERGYVLRTLTSGVLRGLSDTVLRADPAGLARAAAIIIGLGATVYGFLYAKFCQAQARPQQAEALGAAE
jgi:glucosyl-dolichyl phosphate glucuronosyltransferase